MSDSQGTSTYSYDAVGNQSAVVYPNAFSQHYQYNTVNRLTQMEHHQNGTVVERYNYTLDATGKRLAMSELNGRSTAWAYDVLNRLSSEAISHNGSVTHEELSYRTPTHLTPD